MPKNTFFISDPHFGHEKVSKFLRKDGTNLRPFESAFDMDETLVSNWNSVVKPEDKVYVLGDVAMARKHIATVSRCNGRKVLIRGNHDIFKLADYVDHFEDVRGVHVMPARDMILSHIPLHPDSVNRFRVNVHGHLHDNLIEDHRYVSVCVEQINYTPIAYEDLQILIAKNRELYEQSSQAL